MAVKKTQDKTAEKLLGVLLATAGGFGATFGMNQLDTRVKPFRDNPILSPLTNAGVATAVLFTSPIGWHPLAYGMLGASGGDFANDLVNGLSRIQVDSSMNQDDMDEMEEGYGDSRDTDEGDNDDNMDRDRPVRDSDFDYPTSDSGDGTG